MMQSSPPAGRRRELSRCFAVFLFGCGRSLAVAAHAALLQLLLVAAADPAVPMASGFSVQFRVRRWIGGDVAGAGSGLGSYVFCDLADPTLAAQHTEPQLTNLVAQDKVTDGFPSSQLASRLPGGHELPADRPDPYRLSLSTLASHRQLAGSVTHARVDSICTGGSIACWGATIDITRVVQCS